MAYSDVLQRANRMDVCVRQRLKADLRADITAVDEWSELVFVPIFRDCVLSMKL